MKRTVCLSVLVALMSVFCGVAAEAPKLLPFQGRLTDQNGVAVSNGVRLVQFKIFEVPTSGSPVWAGELHRTTVNGGLVNVLLGSKTPFSGLDFNRQLYLEITVDINGDNAITAADPPMLPRQTILPVVFATESADSRKLAGYDWTPIFGTNNPQVSIPASKLADGSLPGAKIQPGSITSNQIAPAAIGAQHFSPAALTMLVPPGSVMAFADGSAPPGWLVCDGQPVSRSTYSNLWAVIGRAWGHGDGSTTFNLPDLRGLFLRGIDLTRGRDPDKAGRTPSDIGGNAGNLVGSLQGDQFASHNHRISFSPFIAASGNTIGSIGSGSERFTDNTGGSETRPKNAYVLYIIKY